MTALSRLRAGPTHTLATPPTKTSLLSVFRFHHHPRLRLGSPRSRLQFVLQPTNPRSPCSRLSFGGTSSLTDACLFLLSVRNADKVPHPGDVSPVQRVKMMSRLAHEVNAAVGLVDAPAFAHKAGILRAARPRARYRHARAFSCAFILQ